MRTGNRIATAYALLSLTSFAQVAHADVSVEACSDAYTQGQEERLAGHLFNAQKQFGVCADPSCPKAIVRDCQRWTSEVAADLPTVLIKTTAATGQAVANLKVTVDGASVSAAELQKPLVLDAGPHVLRFEAPGYEPLQVEPSLRARDHELPINAVLRASTPVSARTPNEGAQSREPGSSHALPTAAIAFAGVGLVALGGSLFFGLSAKSKYNTLKATCAPNCAQVEVDSVHSKAVVSDVALAASALAFGAAAYFYFSAEPEKAGATALGVEPTLNGARARLRVSF